MHRSPSKVVWLVIAAAGGAALVGCGEGYTRTEAVAAVADANPELLSEQVECVTDGLIDRYGLGELGDELAADPPTVGFAEAQFTELFRCGAAGDVNSELTAQLETAGVSAEHAPCVSEQIIGSLTADDIEALLSGEVSDEIALLLASSLEACGAAEPS